jgi:hypothetical protein
MGWNKRLLFSGVRLLILRMCPIFQKRTQDQGRCDLVHDPPVRLPCVSSLVEHLVSFVRRKSFIPQMDRQPR